MTLSQKQSNRSSPMKIMCIGGGAGSEILALASMAKEQDFVTGLHITAVDCADWGPLLKEMMQLVRVQWELDTFRFSLSFKREDILESYPHHDFAATHLITFLFTANELFSASRSKTLSFLSFLSSVCTKGTLLLVAESVGSYSEIAVGDKTYPLELILDRHLSGKDAQWRAVERDPARWYRVPEETQRKYALQVENTHMLVRVFEKV